VLAAAYVAVESEVPVDSVTGSSSVGVSIDSADSHREGCSSRAFILFIFLIPTKTYSHLFPATMPVGAALIARHKSDNSLIRNSK
jgi:hypothetical protein